MTMQGLHSAGEHRWREMEATLSPADREEWMRLAKDHQTEFAPDEKTLQAAIKAAVPELRDGQDPTPDQAKKRDAVNHSQMVEAFRARLARSQMSREGQNRIVSYYSSALKN